METCETCFFWRKFHQVEDQEGLCRRFPPDTLRPETDLWRFPVTHQNEWCGEYRHHFADQYVRPGDPA